MLLILVLVHQLMLTTDAVVMMMMMMLVLVEGNISLYVLSDCNDNISPEMLRFFSMD